MVAAMVEKMLLTFEESQVLAILRERKKFSRNQVAIFIGIHDTTLYKYEMGIRPIPLDIWEKMKSLYNSSLDGIGKLKKCKDRGIKASTKQNRIDKEIDYFKELAESQEMACNMKAMRNSDLDNKLRVNRLLKDLSDVF